MAKLTLNLADTARYLHLRQSDVERLMQRHEIPFRRTGARITFVKSELDAWASHRIMGFDDRQLTAYHDDSHRGTTLAAGRQPLVRHLLAVSQMTAALNAKTRASVLREMVRLADATGFVIFPDDLLASLEAREALCSTALPGGLALLHPRHHDEYMFDESFLLLARAVQPVPFNAPDGQRTDLFFLLCCRDDRLHLHLLSRLCMLCTQTAMLDQLREAPDAKAMLDVLTASENELLVTMGQRGSR